MEVEHSSMVVWSIELEVWSPTSSRQVFSYWMVVPWAHLALTVMSVSFISISDNRIRLEGPILILHLRTAVPDSWARNDL